MYKKLSASGASPPVDPAGRSAPRPPFRLALHALAMVPALWQILDPPLRKAVAMYDYVTFGC